MEQPKWMTAPINAMGFHGKKNPIQAWMIQELSGEPRACTGLWRMSKILRGGHSQKGFLQEQYLGQR